MIRPAFSAMYVVDKTPSEMDVVDVALCCFKWGDWNGIGWMYWNIHIGLNCKFNAPTCKALLRIQLFSCERGEEDCAGNGKADRTRRKWSLQPCHLSPLPAPHEGERLDPHQQDPLRPPWPHWQGPWWVTKNTPFCNLPQYSGINVNLNPHILVISSQ